MKKALWILFFGLHGLLSQKSLAQVPPRQLGGEGSVDSQTETAFSLPLKNSARSTRTSFAIGHSLFRQNWVEAPASVRTFSGLGPLFNAQSCSTCHANDGRGSMAGSGEWASPALLFRLSLPGKGPHGEPVPIPNYGDQLNPLGISKVAGEGRVKVTYEEVKGTYPDGSSYSLQKPHYYFEQMNYGPLPSDFRFSPRLGPQVIGLGLLEAIPEADLLKNADPEDKNGDGISGRPNWVWNVAHQKTELGRFGWKANQPSLNQQDAGAFLGDMGVTSSLFASENCMAIQTTCKAAVSGGHPEIVDSNLKHLTTYIQSLAVPLRKEISPDIDVKGWNTFQKISCAQCHAGPYTTGSFHELAELRGQKIYPFTDLLLHDMGEDLADHREDYLATGSEWRTPPLWGLGRVQEIHRQTGFLHDGRARSIEEAILWHSGEAEGSKKKFMSLSKEERQQLLQFLESL